jgi:hypothetical protein
MALQRAISREGSAVEYVPPATAALLAAERAAAAATEGSDTEGSPERTPPAQPLSPHRLPPVEESG